jgi:sugar-specific transcriptional regulator TrmB
MNDQLSKDLEKIGLSANEAKIYLASLSLGDSTAQMIAAKATVTRPTTYIAIESLIQRGLMSSFQKGKKRYFAAGAPTQLAHILQNQKKEILERERVVEDLVSRLKNVGGASDKPYARVFEGVDGIRAAQEDMLDSDADELLQVFAPVDELHDEPTLFGGDLTEKLFKKFKKVRQLTSDAVKRSAASGKKRAALDVRTFPGNHPDLKGEMVIYGDKVGVTSYHEGDPATILIQDKNMAAILRAMFTTLWDKSK